MATCEKTCASDLCGRPFLPKRNRVRYCSPACAPLVHGERRKRDLACDACGAPFRSGRVGARFCSNRCRTAHGAWAYRPAAKGGAR